MSFLSHLECGMCGARHEADRLQNLCTACAKPLLARYDVEAAKERVTRDAWERGVDSLWRFRDMLPGPRAQQERRHGWAPVTLGEGMTPLLPAPRLAESLGLPKLLVKDESGNPTGSFKARGMTAAVTMARELGAKALAVPSAGNAGAALAAYAAAAGLPADVYLPADTPPGIARQVEAFGGRAHLVKGLITDAAKEVQARAARGEVFDVSTLREPYRAEGKKTMGYEVVMQNGWRMPDVIVYPTGGGTGIVGMWKAFSEMEALGLVGSERPRMVSVQSAGCAPIVRALSAGAESAAPWEDAATSAWGLRVPRAIADFLILRALRASGGAAVAVSEESIAQAQRDMARLAGMYASPEGAATLAGLRALLDDGTVRRDEQVVLFQTGSMFPYA
ncbi:MAG TPA: threonine synthase [Candidatus Thermoplasmatota archaeon]|nr:threonine synthase [Candidatus Thermoplasmatota archaeon]